MTIRLVADTSALISLALVDCLDLLGALGYKLAAAPAVVRELRQMTGWRDALSRAAESALQAIAGLETTLDQTAQDLASQLAVLPGLDQGEVETLALAAQLHSSEILVDDVRAMGGLAGVARTLEVHIVPSSYVLVKAYLGDLLTYGQIVQLLQRLAVSRGWEESVLYHTALVMMEQVRMVKEEQADRLEQCG